MNYKKIIILGIPLLLLVAAAMGVFFKMVCNKTVPTPKNTDKEIAEILRLKRELAKALKDATEKQKKLSELELQKLGQKDQVAQLKNDLEKAKQEASGLKTKLEQQKNQDPGCKDYPRSPEQNYYNGSPVKNPEINIPNSECDQYDQEEELDKQIADYEDFLGAMDQVLPVYLSKNDDNSVTGSNKPIFEDQSANSKSPKCDFDGDEVSKKQKLDKLQKKSKECTSKMLEQQTDKAVDELKQALACGLGQSLSNLSR